MFFSVSNGRGFYIELEGRSNSKEESSDILIFFNELTKLFGSWSVINLTGILFLLGRREISFVL